MKSLLLTFFCTSIALIALGQQKPLHRGLNIGSKNHASPKLSADGSYMLYTTNIVDGKDQIMYVENKGGKWGRQELVGSPIDIGEVNTKGGYNLTYDNKEFFFTSKRRGGIGGYDLWLSDKRGLKFGTPSNFGKPLNTLENEGDPSLSPDGKTLYFCRCSRMTATSASGCKIMMSQRKGKRAFTEAVELPAPINQGNEVAPLMLADNQTLIFASDRAGGKGGLDLYMSRKEGNGWSQPVPVAYANTPNDNRYISIPAKGNLAYFSKKVGGYDNLVMAKVPDNLKQKDIVWMVGKVTGMTPDAGKFIMQIYDHKTRKETLNFTDSDGSYMLFLAAGGVYDLSVRDPKGQHTFTSRLLDLSKLSETKRETWDIQLDLARTGVEMPLQNVTFAKYKTAFDPRSSRDLNRLMGLLKKNSIAKVEIGVAMEKYKSDSTKSHPDLTELIEETIVLTKTMQIVDSIWAKDTIRMDTANPNNYTLKDTLIRVDTRDSSYKVKKIKRTYHNDRTQAQAQKLVDYLTKKGVPSSRIKAKGYRDRKPEWFKDGEESTKVVVKFL